MTEENPGATTETPQADLPANESGDDKVFTQDQVNSFVAGEKRKRQKSEETIAELQKQLEEIKQAQKSEEEKALDDAYKRGQKETEQLWRAKWDGAELDRKIERTLANKGLHTDLAPIVKGQDDLDAESVETAIDKLISEHPLFQTKGKERSPSIARSAPTTGGGDLKPGRTWKSSEIGAVKAEYGGRVPKEYTNEWQKARIEGRIVKDTN